MKSEAVAALPKLRRGLGGADFEDCFLNDAGHDSVYCFRLALVFCDSADQFELK